LLEQVQKGEVAIDNAVEQLRHLPVKDLGHARIDMHRELRVGHPEVIYCAGKTIDQITDIVACMLEHDTNILATRATREMFEAVHTLCSDAEFHEAARAITIVRRKQEPTKTYIAVITAGTCDIPFAEEAAITAEIFGNTVERIFDVGVAGIHRLMDKLDLIRKARVCIVVAGMEGALASVVAGLVDKPVIAVPTSIGYGANFGGLSALLGMLTSCAGGVTVVNIDNGFGAGCAASIINKL
jgi:NCAIR mutase (PurE)-related protein